MGNGDLEKLMLNHPGRPVAKKGNESRKWAMVAQAYFFWTRPRVKTAEAGKATYLA